MYLDTQHDLVSLKRGSTASMLKIERSANGQVVFTLSGRIKEEEVENLRQVLATETGTLELVLDLRNVTLVNQNAVEFLSICEADGIRLASCPLYIRKWIEQSKTQKSRGR